MSKFKKLTIKFSFLELKSIHAYVKFCLFNLIFKYFYLLFFVSNSYFITNAYYFLNFDRLIIEK